MPSRRAFTRLSALALPIACTAFLGGCDGPTGGYPPPPPPYEAPASALELAKTPKFRPLIAALQAQRAAARELAAFNAEVAGRMDEVQQERYQQLFGKVLEASRAVGAAVKAAGLSADELAAWSAVSALDDAKLSELAK
ncbi:MAG: hypothetical protein GC172_08585 [Phycisphaera sp.]|nr:hypothetical protein [Phycisphaera sp.]